MLAEFMPLFMITLVVFALFFVLMSIGYIIQKKPLRGSCGGVAAIMGNESCEFCGGDPNKCDNQDVQNTIQQENTLGKNILDKTLKDDQIK